MLLNESNDVVLTAADRKDAITNKIARRVIILKVFRCLGGVETPAEVEISSEVRSLPISTLNSVPGFPLREKGSNEVLSSIAASQNVLCT